MSSLELDTGMVYEPSPEKKEDPEREAKILVFKLILCPDQFTLADLSRLSELFEEMSLHIEKHAREGHRHPQGETRGT